MPALVRFHIQIQSALADGGDVRQIKPRIGHGPARVDRCGIRHEAHAHPGGIAAQIPDGFAHDPFGLGGQPVVKIFRVVPAAAFDVKLADIKPKICAVRPDRIGRRGFSLFHGKSR